jgi:hypothetical protein
MSQNHELTHEIIFNILFNSSITSIYINEIPRFPLFTEFASMTQNKQKKKKSNKRSKRKMKHYDGANPYIIMRVDRVPTRISFLRILTEIYPFSRHIIGIFRTADYAAKRLSQTVYILCTSVEEASILEDQIFSFAGIDNPPFYFRIVNSKFISVSIEDRIGAIRYTSVPISVYITGLTRCKDFHDGKVPENASSSEDEDLSGYTDYLAQVAQYFQTKGLLTGIRFGYDPVRKQTRSDAFLTYMYQRDARDLIGDNIVHSISCETIVAEMSRNSPMIIREDSDEAKSNGPWKWSSGLQMQNMLEYFHSSPYCKEAIPNYPASSGDEYEIDQEGNAKVKPDIAALSAKARGKELIPEITVVIPRSMPELRTSSRDQPGPSKPRKPSIHIDPPTITVEIPKGIVCKPGTSNDNKRSKGNQKPPASQELKRTRTNSPIRVPGTTTAKENRASLDVVGQWFKRNSSWALKSAGKDRKSPKPSTSTGITSSERSGASATRDKTLASAGEARDLSVVKAPVDEQLQEPTMEASVEQDESTDDGLIIDEDVELDTL